MSYPIQVVSSTDSLVIPRNEILRYMRCPEDTPTVHALTDEAIAAVTARLQCRACYTRFRLTATANALDLGFAVTESNSLRQRLAGCDEVLLFAATLGSEIDRLLLSTSAVSPARAVAVDAAATAAIEAWCDRLCDDWRAVEQGTFCPRFSPGYGDCPLTMQIPLLQALDASRKIGVSLTDSLLMTPTKSVTALIGISHKETLVTE